MIDLLNKLLSLTTENEVVEFKEARRQYDKNKLRKYFSALSNEANLSGKSQAWLVFGVKNDKTVIGTIINDHQINDYKAEIANHSSPKLSFVNVHRVNYQGRDVLMFEIPAAPEGNPVSWKGFWYGRDGESLGALNLNELENIRNQNKSYDWSAQIIEQATLDDLDLAAIQKAREMFAIKNPKLKEQIPTWSDRTFLNKAKLTIKGQLTHAAILLLAKPESEHFISPATAKISWILKDKDNLEKDYQHFSCPLLLEVENLKSKIRNLKYRYIKDGSLFPDEVDQYDPYIIREALNNCIAHQDYSLGGKINIVENEAGELIFSNMGSFIPVSVEQVIKADAPESRYRNSFLANAMVNLNMIDTIGSGIKRMFVIQKNKYFPLPDYDLSNNQVKVKITAKVLDIKYARKIAQLPELSLAEIILLDKVAKQKLLTDEEIKSLKAKKLIEGRKPNFHISSEVAKASGDKARYIKQRGIDDTFYEQLILQYLNKFQVASSADLKKLLLDKLPEILAPKQKENKIRNMLQKMKRNSLIKLNENREWQLV
ncbi:putative transcriptional regulator with HTH domain [Saprospira grandis DSM 2844]|uniref:Putative transcriptional regulator with HTH domain n=1 Tax=Saprospira grandis DSM 2844 TaxID=694433 RepID=J1I5D5_9BACT|nr:RNA-binding domain-containing protein [Saprospira grandis]EJF53985.1 putative transcriptional regulator with HTH domain [Saprospira grandis DSM 2844]